MKELQCEILVKKIYERDDGLYHWSRREAEDTITLSVPFKKGDEMYLSLMEEGCEVVLLDTVVPEEEIVDEPVS